MINNSILVENKADNLDNNNTQEKMYSLPPNGAEKMNTSKCNHTCGDRIIAPKDSTFQVRIISEVKKTVEEIYAKTGMTLTDAFNTFIQQSLNVEGLPFIVTKNSKEALREQAVAMLMMDLKRAEERAEVEGWIDADDLERELGGID